MYASFNSRALGLAIPAETTLDLAARAGFAGVDLLVRDLLEVGSDPITLRRRMDDLGLRGGAWPLPVRWRGAESVYRADLRQLPRQAAAAAMLGLYRTGTWVLPETPERPGPGQDEAGYLARVTEFHRDRLGAIARILADHGSRLGLEVIGVESFRTGRGLPFVDRLANLGPRLGMILEDHPNVGIVVDAFHLYAAGEDPTVALGWGARRIVWAHMADLPHHQEPTRAAVRDEDRGLPGENGAVDVSGCLAALQQAGYDGPVMVETLAGCRSLAGLEPASVARVAAESLRRAWPDPQGWPTIACG